MAAAASSQSRCPNQAAKDRRHCALRVWRRRYGLYNIPDDIELGEQAIGQIARVL